MSSWRRFWMAVLLAILLAPAAHGSVQSLGQVTVPVEDRETASRNAAIEEGLARVLVRLSGQSAPRALPGASQLFQSPARWVQQFGYEEVSPPQAQPTTEAPAGEPGIQLAMQFDVSAVISAMEQAGLPVWATHRPPVLAWLVIQRPGFGEIVAREQADPVRKALVDQARLRGLPLVLPAMNDRDQAAIGPADIRGRFDHVIDAASQPYGTRFRLVAVLYTGSTARLRWRLLDGMNQIAEGELDGSDEASLVAELANQVTGYFVSRYTVTAGAGVERRLTVRGIANLQDWHQLERYLSGLAGMKQARLASVAADEVQFALVFGGGDEQLMRLLEVHRHLSVCAPLPADAAATIPSPVQPEEQVPDLAAELAPVCWQP